jgi:3-dehydroquinate dehydratase/shikimate dehydrogenase
MAAMSSLEDTLGISPTEEKPLAGKTALVMGCGGAGMAITYGLVRRGAHVLLSDIAGRKAELMAERFSCVAIDWSDRHKANPDILVNCTPVGMHPNVDETPYEKHHLRPSMLVFDVVYNPENTLLIKDARSRNCTVVTGVEMFVRQARMQFKYFTGQDGPAELMRDVIRRTIGAAKM